MAGWLESVDTIFDGENEVFLIIDMEGTSGGSLGSQDYGSHNGLIEQNMGRCNIFPVAVGRGAPLAAGFDFA